MSVHSTTFPADQPFDAEAALPVAATQQRAEKTLRGLGIRARPVERRRAVNALAEATPGTTTPPPELPKP